MIKFVLLNGYVEIDNKQLYLKLKNREVKERGGLIMIFFGIYLINSIHSYTKEDKVFANTGDFIQLFLQIIGGLVIFYLIYYFLFKKKWSKNHFINEIDIIKIDKDEFETEFTIQFSNKREINLEFRNLENQLEPFLDELKKRNSRIEIKNIN